MTFTVRGKPQPKQRARKGRNGRWYTPEPTRRFERTVGIAARAAGVRPGAGAYRVEVVIHEPDHRKRDIDNILKSVLDGLNGIAWEDDRQVIGATVTRGEVDRESPRTVVTVEAVKP